MFLFHEEADSSLRCYVNSRNFYLLSRQIPKSFIRIKKICALDGPSALHGKG